MWHQQPSIGNDIVDLLAPEPVLHPRYIERVFTANEQAFVREKRANLWLTWAAKEAAYKAVKRWKPNAYFSPRTFEFDAVENVVVYEGVRLPCFQMCSGQYVAVQCLSCRLECRPAYHWVSEISEYNPDLLLHNPSAAVRSFAARCIGEKLNISPTQISFSAICLAEPRIPCLLVCRVPSRHFVSFSHHGRFVACSFMTMYPD